MTERDLSTLLHDELAGEPPVAATSHDAIRSGRRADRIRLGVIGGACAVVVAAAAVVLPNLGGDDKTGAPAIATDPVSAPSITDVMQAKTAEALSPYVGELGDPRVTISSVDQANVEADDPSAQFFLLDYRPTGGETVQLNVNVAGFALSDWAKYDFDHTCEQNEADDLSAMCETEYLDDDTQVITEIGARSAVQTDAPRVLRISDALKKPDGVIWTRGVSVTTRDGMVVGISEMVRAKNPESADWQIPLEVIRNLALDPDLIDFDVAKEPFPEFTSE